MKWIIVFWVYFICTNSFAYEWYQVEDDGIYKKILTTKNNFNSNDFEDLKFESKKISTDEIKTKFPNYEHPKNIIIIGDTGCRIAEKNGRPEYQDCNNPKAWPLQAIMNQVQLEHGDLIIHLGDYHYRESCSVGKDCQKMTNSYGYSWKPWELDFFIPTEKTLKNVPIIIVRGNHEDCHRAYLGYGKYLANQVWDKECLEYEDAKIISYGDLGIINLDNSSLDDKPITDKTEETKWVERFNQIAKKLDHNKFKTVWLITHKPAYGLAPFMGAYAPVNINFRNFLEKSILAKKVNYIFSGHIHTSMLVRANDWPGQIVLGNSGTKLDNYKAINPNFLKLFNYSSADVFNNGFGYAVLKEIATNKWSVDFKDSDGKVLKSINL